MVCAGTLSSIAEVPPEAYAAIAAQTRQLWPSTPDGGFVTELSLKQALDVVNAAARSVLQASTLGKELSKQIFQTANKGADSKPRFLTIASRTADRKSLFNVLP